MGKRLGDAADPLLVSVRSGAKFSMPGMMDTVLNLGLNDVSVQGLADADRRTSGSPGTPTGGSCRCSARSCWTSRPSGSRTCSTRPRSAKGPEAKDTDLDADDLRALTEEFKAIDPRGDGAGLPRRSRRAQLERPIEAVFRVLERRPGRRLPAAEQDQRRPGHGGERRGHGVRQHGRRLGHRAWRSPATRPPASSVPYGDYLANAQGEDVVAGIRNTLPLDRAGRDRPAVLASSSGRAWTPWRSHYRDMCDIEFTIETRHGCGSCRRGWASGRRFAEWVMAYDMWKEGLISPDEGLLRLDAEPARAAVQARHPGGPRRRRRSRRRRA